MLSLSLGGSVVLSPAFRRRLCVVMGLCWVMIALS